MTDIGQIVSSQDFISGTEPKQGDVDLFLANAGLVPVKQNFWLWKKSYAEEGYEVMVGDARADNFVETKTGIVPIDIRIWFSSQVE